MRLDRWSDNDGDMQAFFNFVLAMIMNVLAVLLWQWASSSHDYWPLVLLSVAWWSFTAAMTGAKMAEWE